MVEIINCPNCNGRGCQACQDKGTVIRDESGKLYINTIENNTGQRRGKTNSFVSSFLKNVFAEPHDFFWVIKTRK